MAKDTNSTTNLTIVFLILIKNVAQIGGYAATYLATYEGNNVETHRLAKRMDLESCLGQFDIHKNTIIRTGESQAIGGKYLQGIELDTMEECQHLCCETDSCDVYIFESKKDGYCYLFECGTPENFHCKFTRHANYTSAVLTPVIRHANDEVAAHPPASHLGHSSSSNISQQEWELSNLKLKGEIKEKINDGGLSGSGATNSLTSGNKKSLTGMEAILTQKENNSVQCGRFQFACHSGECIAVYNACDGIPQCEDGSDEGPECSGANNNLNTNIKSTQDATSANKAMAVSSLSQYPISLSQQTPQQQLQSMQHHSKIPAILPSLINNREDPNVWETRKIVSGTTDQVVGNENHGNPESTNLKQVTAQQQLQQQRQQQQQSDSFTSYVNNREQNNAVYGVGSSTLQQSGLYMPHVGQDITNNIYTAQQQQNILLPLPPPPPPAPLNSNWQQQAILNQQKQQQQQQQFAGQTLPQQQQKTLPGVSVTYTGQNEAIQTQQEQQAPSANTMAQQQKQQSVPNLVPSLTQQQQKQEQHQPPLQTSAVSLNEAANAERKLNDSDEYEDSEEKSTEPPKKHKHKKVKSKSKAAQQYKDVVDDAASHSGGANSIKSVVAPVHEQYEIIHQNMALEFRDHDGQSERPGGAVLSLTLGLLITAALAILIGCRMRTVGRRARRIGGKTPYSHEADFLVNGMYL